MTPAAEQPAVGAQVQRPVRPLYAERDHEAQGRYYTRHIDAMTREGLHDKSAIAGELAHRDLEIASVQGYMESLQDSYGQLMAENARLRAELAEVKTDRERWIRRADKTWNEAQAVAAERERCAKQLDALGCDHCAAALRRA